MAKNTSRVPHPYTEDDAFEFLGIAAIGWATGGDLLFAIVEKASGAYLGGCGVHPAHGWEIGYWLGKPYWGQGYATEAAGRLLAYAFNQCAADRLTARWFHDNPASGRVLAKLGFQPEAEDVSDCRARGVRVKSHVAALDRAAYMTRKKAA